MSAIATFKVLEAERLGLIVAAATPVRSGWFRAARDPFPGVLRDAGRELEAFRWSGWAFNTLDLYLESRHGFHVRPFRRRRPQSTIVEGARLGLAPE